MNFDIKFYKNFIKCSGYKLYILIFLTIYTMTQTHCLQKTSHSNKIELIPNLMWKLLTKQEKKPIKTNNYTINSDKPRHKDDYENFNKQYTPLIESYKKYKTNAPDNYKFEQIRPNQQYNHQQENEQPYEKNDEIEGYYQSHQKNDQDDTYQDQNDENYTQIEEQYIPQRSRSQKNETNLADNQKSEKLQIPIYDGNLSYINKPNLTKPPLKHKPFKKQNIIHIKNSKSSTQINIDNVQYFSKKTNDVKNYFKKTKKNLKKQSIKHVKSYDTSNIDDSTQNEQSKIKKNSLNNNQLIFHPNIHNNKVKLIEKTFLTKNNRLNSYSLDVATWIIERLKSSKKQISY